MAIVDLVQRTDKWFAWRKLGITASMIPVIMGLSPYQTPYELWAELVGLKAPADLSNNWHVQRGVEQEPEARSTVERELGKPFMPVCVEADHNSLFKASLDGLFKLKDLVEVLEIKCPCKKIYMNICELKGKSENFQMYAAQVQWQLNCAGAESAFLYFYLRGERPINAKIKRNQGFIDKAEAKALEFWNLVQTKTPPQLIDGRDKVVYELPKTDSKWETNVESYKSISTQINECEQKSKALKAQAQTCEDYFVQQIPDGVKTFDKDGIRATKCNRAGKLDNDAFLAALAKKTGLLQSDLTDMQESFRASDSSYYRVGVSTSTVSNIQPNEVVKDEIKEVSETQSQQQPEKIVESENSTELVKPIPAAAFFKEKATQNMFF
ncbi:lambda-exonuclease family protein [Psychromonas aquimarina]|uniref:lambda-exonuclease family protein n=1 Tax=Psychromonas aquimarina TaxID=444919 RepID=UPI000404476D|nr:YqaJ viral recombinase family protein [Psychromonas aquimarina]